MTASVAQIAESVVRRDRAGDQNAKALIIECRKAAQKGSAKAQQMIRAIIHYCQTHPLRTGSVGFGAEVAQLGPAFTASASAPLLPPPGTPPGALALPPASVRGLGLLKGLVCLGEGDESGLDGPGTRGR